MPRSNQFAETANEKMREDTVIYVGFWYCGEKFIIVSKQSIPSGKHTRHINRQAVGPQDAPQFCLHSQFLLLPSASKMPKDSIKKEGRYDDKVDAQCVENGALESSFQFSADAEKKLVRKIDFMWAFLIGKTFPMVIR